MSKNTKISDYPAKIGLIVFQSIPKDVIAITCLAI